MRLVDIYLWKIGFFISVLDFNSAYDYYCKASKLDRIATTHGAVSQIPTIDFYFMVLETLDPQGDKEKAQEVYRTMVLPAQDACALIALFRRVFHENMETALKEEMIRLFMLSLKNNSFSQEQHIIISKLLREIDSESNLLLLARQQITRAQQMIAKGQYEKAGHALMIAVTLGASRREVQEAQARIDQISRLWKKIEKAQENKNVEEALRNVEKILSQNPGDILAQVKRQELSAQHKVALERRAITSQIEECLRNANNQAQHPDKHDRAQKNLDRVEELLRGFSEGDAQAYAVRLSNVQNLMAQSRNRTTERIAKTEKENNHNKAPPAVEGDQKKNEPSAVQDPLETKTIRVYITKDLWEVLSQSSYATLRKQFVDSAKALADRILAGKHHYQIKHITKGYP
ncbi:MAG TPA: hypothetical protein PLO93_07590, partial [Candidatus Omnitrophota bacterium]|nr:hypothetical protein [Candidatus Omnitrophota bacterium]